MVQDRMMSIFGGREQAIVTRAGGLGRPIGKSRAYELLTDGNEDMDLSRSVVEMMEAEDSGGSMLLAFEM